MSNWSTLSKKVADAYEESRVKVGPGNFYRASTMKEVLDWMQEMGPVGAAGGDNRLVCGTGSDANGPYEVVRIVRSKEYRREYANGNWSKISLAEAVSLVHEPTLGKPGLSAFDKAYAARERELQSIAG